MTTVRANVDIFGQRLGLRTEGDGTRLHELARFVDLRMQEVAERFLSMNAGHSIIIHRSGRATPAANGVTIESQSFSNLQPESAGAEYAYVGICGGYRSDIILYPLLSALRHALNTHLTLRMQNTVECVFSHLLGHAGIAQPYDRCILWQSWMLEDTVDTR